MNGVVVRRAAVVGRAIGARAGMTRAGVARARSAFASPLRSWRSNRVSPLPRPSTPTGSVGGSSVGGSPTAATLSPARGAAGGFGRHAVPQPVGWARLACSASFVGGIQQIEVEVVRHELEQGHDGGRVVVLDCREPDEWAGELGCIAGGSGALPTIFLPLGDVERGWEDALADATEGLDGGDDGAAPLHVICVCKAGVRSQAAAAHVAATAAAGELPWGVTVSNMSGGMLSWVAKFGRPEN